MRFDAFGAVGVAAVAARVREVEGLVEIAQERVEALEDMFGCGVQSFEQLLAGEEDLARLGVVGHAGACTRTASAKWFRVAQFGQMTWKSLTTR